MKKSCTVGQQLRKVAVAAKTFITGRKKHNPGEQRGGEVQEKLQGRASVGRHECGGGEEGKRAQAGLVARHDCG